MFGFNSFATTAFNSLLKFNHNKEISWNLLKKL